MNVLISQAVWHIFMPCFLLTTYSKVFFRLYILILCLAFYWLFIWGCVFLILDLFVKFKEFQDIVAWKIDAVFCLFKLIIKMLETFENAWNQFKPVHWTRLDHYNQTQTLAYITPLSQWQILLFTHVDSALLLPQLVSSEAKQTKNWM